MRWKTAERYVWAPWFAWHPVVARSARGPTWVWLERIWRFDDGCFGCTYSLERP